jgi:methionyl-tRNA formyltransferase
MNIVLVMSEDIMWKPVFIGRLIRELPEQHKIVGVVLTGFGYETFGYIGYLKRYFNILGLKAFIYVALRNIKYSIIKYYYRVTGRYDNYSISGVCRQHGIPVHYTNDVNSVKTLSWIRALEPDISFSSGHQIFGVELLSIPKRCCINRHSSLLPAFRGIYPLFWNLLNDEKEAGVSIHAMEKKIDAGRVVSQKSFPIEPEDSLFSLFDKCYDISVELVIEALEKIDLGNWLPVQNSRYPSYYTFPTRKEGREFRKKGKKIR